MRTGSSKQLRLPVDRELVVDYFCGGGGTSTGIAAALGRAPDIAVNHNAEALAMHKANHPETIHITEDVYRVKLQEELHGWPVGLLWASPDCRHHSRAKGGQPVDRRIRGLAWSVNMAAHYTCPRVIIVENVPEFEDWGPVDAKGLPIKSEKGRTFAAWVKALQRKGYAVEWKKLSACDYGTPTTRARLFIVARCDGKPILWPSPTHGPGLIPYRTAAEIIDWSVPTRSIFGRKHPLKPNTMQRIAKGIKRYVFEAQQPFILKTRHHSPKSGQGSQFRGQALTDPLRTVTGTNDNALIVPHISKFFGGVVGSSITNPLSTVTAVDHNALVAAFLTKYYGTATGASLHAPTPTVTSKDRFGLVTAYLQQHGMGGQTLTIDGCEYTITDIGLRMLEPRELARAQGFGDDYKLTPKTKAGQVAKIGNSVCPQVAEALVRANYRPMCMTTARVPVLPSRHEEERPSV